MSDLYKEANITFGPLVEVEGKNELATIMAKYPHLFDDEGNLAMGEPMNLAFDALLKMRGV